MAIRFDATGERLERASDLLDYNSNYTLMGWFYISVDTNAFTSLMQIHNNGDSGSPLQDRVFTDSDGTTLRASVRTGSSNVANNGGALGVEGWNHLAMVRVSATVLEVYLNAELSVTITNDISGRGAAARMQIGEQSALGNNLFFFNGRCSHLRAWSTNLSQAQIQAEMTAPTAVVTDDLYGDWPTPAGGDRANDVSGAARHFTEVGTLSDEAGPPLDESQTGSESGAASESASVAVTLGGADSGNQSEATTPAAALAGGEAGSLAEGAAIVALAVASESGSIAENVATSAALAATDSANLVENGLVETPDRQASESGSGSESATIVALVAASDTLSLVDIGVLAILSTVFKSGGAIGSPGGAGAISSPSRSQAISGPGGPGAVGG